MYEVEQPGPIAWAMLMWISTGGLIRLQVLDIISICCIYLFVQNGSSSWHQKKMAYSYLYLYIYYGSAGMGYGMLVIVDGNIYLLGEW